ncbi:unnamed protein product, partial [Phaeothamnion confervicola]
QVSVGDPLRSEYVDVGRYARLLGLGGALQKQDHDSEEREATQWQQARGRKLTHLCRLGVPENFRGGIWNKLMSQSEETAGTPADKASATQERAWQRVAGLVFADGATGQSPEDVPPYGGQLRLDEFPLSAEGCHAACRVLVAAKHMFAIEWCPTLLDVVPLLLVYMPESCAYSVLTEMWDRRPLFFPVSPDEAAIWFATFRDLLRKFAPQAAAAMAACGADKDEHLQDLILRGFAAILPFPLVVIVFDAWLSEGNKVLFRYGIGLLKHLSKSLRALSLGAGDGGRWWAHVRAAAAAPDFDFPAVRKAAFGLRRRLVVPLTWSLLEKVHNANESKAGGRIPAAEVAGTGDGDHHHHPVYWPPFALAATFPPPALLNAAAERGTLVRWVPEVQRHRRLQVVYSTEVHGFSLSSLYMRCRGVAPSLLVVESASGAVFGGFCTHPWQPAMGAFGSGQCFLFRLNPGPPVLYR